MGIAGQRAPSAAGRFTLLALAALLLAIAFVPSARGADLSTRLANAEAAVRSAEAEVEDAASRAASARARYAAARRVAAPAKRATRAANRDARELEAELTAREAAAADRVASVEAANQDEVDEHDREVSGGIAVAIAALVAGAIALGWRWFRVSPPVAWLSQRPRAQSVALCVFGGFVLIAVGGALIDAAQTVGLAIALLGIVFPIALVLALRSVEVERGTARPLLGSGRLPGWTTRAVAAAMLVLALVGIGGALAADDPEPATIPARVQRVADGDDDAANRGLEEAEAEAAAVQAKADRLTAAEGSAGRASRRARNRLVRAEGDLAGAKGEVRRLTRRLALIGERERREREEQEELEEEEFEEEELEGGSGGCDPNYAGACLDPSSPDYDCAGGSGDGPDYTGPVQVVGSDHYGLDADGDGYACE